jgi:hypothetical protein
MLFEGIDPTTSDVISKVKIVVRVTPKKESAFVNFEYPSCNVISHIYLFWAGYSLEILCD